MLKIIKLTENGVNEQSSRVDGIKIKEMILSQKETLSPEDKIVIDFEGIEYISTGFAKEAIAAIFRDEKEFFKTHIALKVGDNENIKNIILIALNSVG